MRLPPSLKVAWWPIDRLTVDGRNPRLHPPAQVRRIVRSIQEFGWTNPILADGGGLIIAGEARWIAARQLRLDAVPVIVLDHLTPVQREAYRIADNRIPEGAGWDERLLAQVMTELQAEDFDLSMTGFDDDELSRILQALPGTVPPEGEDVAPPPPEQPVTRLGDIWLMGRHRLICGDSTRPETLAALMGQGADMVFTDPPYGMTYEGGRARRKADMVFTDPPYGMSFGAGKEAGSSAKGATVKAHGMILGDDARGAELVSLVGQALKRGAEVAKPGAAFYVCFTWRTYPEFAQALAEAGLKPAACIVWDKGSIGLGFQHYRPQHEFVFYVAGERWYGGRNEADVWEFSRGRTEDYVHPTQKPVELVLRALENSSLPGDVVLDMFGGSGSTVIACERVGRNARAVELDPKYCDVIVRRWQALTGGSARRAADRRVFAEIAEERAIRGDCGNP